LRFLLSKALTYIANGYPEMMDPTPADILMMQLKGFKKELEKKFGDWKEGISSEAINDIKVKLEAMMDTNMEQGFLDEIVKYMEEKEPKSYDELWNSLKEIYN
jgi:hypothetical protein